MRGDSVRDLYAKALALLGLAVLAGAGALVDYWPVQGNLPAISFTFSLPSHPSPLGAQLALASPVGAPSARPAMTAAPRAVEPSPNTATLSVVTVPDEEPPVVPTTAADVAVTEAPTPVAAVAEEPMPIIDAGLSVSMSNEFLPPTKVSHTSETTPASASSGNPLQKAGDHLLNAGFAVGTGVATAFSAFGTAFGHIGKLFAR